jgi:pimeloyl-ACP methyl ester carboxylesterase
MQLFSRIYGEGEPLIILHGLFGMGDNWITLAKKFAENFEVHVVDQRNHGKSFHSENWDYDFMVKDLEKYFEDKNIDKAYILGHSMGGKTAMNFACIHPDKVKKLIVADIAPKYYPVHHQKIIEALISVNFDIVQSRKDVEVQLSKFINDYSIKQFLMKGLYWIEKGKLAFRYNIKVIQTNIENVGKALDPNLIFNGETLFLRGVNSNYILDEDIDQIFEHFHHCKLVDIENAGHWLHAENPKDFYKEIMKFILE